MSENLDLLKKDMEEYLEKEGFILFHGEPRLTDGENCVYWQTARHPDYRVFLKTAKAVGAKMIVVVAKEFSEPELENAASDLEGAAIPHTERSDYESHLEDLRLYVGLTSSLELQYSHDNTTYVYWIETDWYSDFNRIIEEIEFSDSPYGAEDKSIGGGFFSNN